MNTYLLIILALLIFSYLLETLVDRLNLSAIQTDIPDEFQGVYEEEKYRKSQQYLRESTRFELLKSTLMLPVSIAFIVLGGFAWVDQLARSAGWGMIPTGLLFSGILILLSQIVGLPFSLYDTFVLEEKYGFNRTTPKVFVQDLLKGLALTVAIGTPVLMLVLWFFSSTGAWGWVWSWLALSVIQMVLLYLAPVYIMPLFNTFTPLAEGDLKKSIETYADRQGFALEGVYTMDGSKRSSRANAYFTGFGKNRRIVLFDTLIEKHTVPELVGVLAHEVGHFKLKHIHKGLLLSLISSGLMLFLLSFFLRSEGLYGAFGVSTEPIGGQFPIYAGMVFFGYLYSPISLLMSLGSNVLSRRHEYEADAYAVATTSERESFITALKKLTVDNLGNLAPHPLKVWLEYSHPPVLQRIAAIRRLP